MLRGRWSVVVIAVGAAAITAIVATTFSVVLRDDRSAMQRAVALADDADAFETALESGQTVARVAQHLEVAVAECRQQDGGAACSALAAALGWSQVLAAWVLDCTDPGRHEARVRLIAYLAEVDSIEADARSVPPPPELPVCT